jgi:CubicO group peptidase (beta-lactamase class C family)
MVTLYEQVQSVWRTRTNPTYMNGVYISGGGGLVSTAEDYLQFAEMLLEGGQLNGKRLLSPTAIALMTSAFVPDTLPGRQAGEGFGLAVRVITDPVAMGTFLSRGSYGWSGGYNTHFWIDPSEHLIGVFLAQTSTEFGVRQEIRSDFETAVMQAVVSRASTTR